MKAVMTAVLGVGLMAQVKPPVPAPAAAPASGSYLGTALWEVDPVQSRQLRLPDGVHVVITLVSPGSPAEAAGLRVGDVVVEYDGKKVESNEQFSRLVRETPAGRSVRLLILRNGVRQMVTAKIGTILESERPRPVVGAAPPQIERQDVPRSLMTWSSSLLGVEGEPVFGQLAGYFGVADGVLVRSVTAGLPGDRAGLKAGDVILRVGKDKVTTPAELAGRLRLANSTTVKLAIMRERHEMALTVTFE